MAKESFDYRKTVKTERSGAREVNLTQVLTSGAMQKKLHRITELHKSGAFRPAKKGAGTA